MEPPTAPSSTVSEPTLPPPPPSPGISVEFHGGEVGKGNASPRPPLAANLSAPAVQQAYQSPIRQHRRTPSQHREVKETLNARTEYTSDDSDGRSHHLINQYTIKEEIGRGSYGAVHLATDQFGNEYAVKEFSKTRLRKRAQSNILKGPRGRPGQMPRRGLFQSRLSDHRTAEARDSLHLIREEIAIMKKLNHPNLVQLYEVLDDPEEDSLYMVLEMCKKGVIMKVGLDQAAEPYGEESCRHWFRDLILGIEYLHCQGVVHRDIKPDNLLLTEDDVLKIVDFGVSEMFERPDEMLTSKSAGSPAFLPPELCVARHGNVSGTAADIWSMGVSLYCLKYGRIPFDRSSPLEIYEAIKTEPLKLHPDEGEDFVDLMNRIMEKDPENRITMPELRTHPWVTKGGSDPLLSAEENCSEMIEDPNDLEVNHAFTRRMSHLLCVMKAISKFKSLLPTRSTPGTPRRVVPNQDASQKEQAAAPSTRQKKGALSDDPAQMKTTEEQAAALIAQRDEFFRSGRASTGPGAKGQGQGQGQAQDLTDREPLFLGIGTGGRDDFAANEPPAEVVSDSPVAVDFNVYDRAYEAEVERLRAQREPSVMYLTRLVGDKGQMRLEGGLVDRGQAGRNSSNNDETGGGQAAFPSTSVAKQVASSGHKFADLVSRTMNEAKEKSQQP